MSSLRPEAGLRPFISRLGKFLPALAVLAVLSPGLLAAPPAAISVTMSSGSLKPQIFSAIYSDPNGSADFTTLSILFNSQISAAHACYVIYNPVLNLLYLTNDADTAQSAGITPGSQDVVSNSQCTLAGANSSYRTSGDQATLNVALTFSGTASSNIYLYASEKNGSASGWVEVGKRDAASGTPAPVSVTPSFGSGRAQVFSAVYSDPNGAADLSNVSLLFNTQISAANGCFVYYNPLLNLLYLTNDAGTAQSAGLTPGSPATVSNSLCTLAGAGSSYAVSGNTATLTLAISFIGTSSTNIYLYAADENGNGSGWVQEGTWVASAGPPIAMSVTPSWGSSSTQTFSAAYSDPNGVTDLSTVSILFNSQLTSANGCYVSYNPLSNLLYLTNDAGTSQLPGLTPGSTATAANSQCTLFAAGSSYTTTGNTAALHVALAFRSTTPVNTYLLATEKNGSSSGWVLKGDWGGALLNSIQVTLAGGSSLTTFSKIQGDVHLALPAGASSGACSGQYVTISLDNTDLGVFSTAASNPATDVCVPAGSQDATFNLTVGSATGYGTITAFASQFQSGMVSFSVAACQVAISLDSSAVGQGHTLGGTIALCKPAPSSATYGNFPNGVTVDLASNAAGVATVTQSVTIPAGQSSGAFTVEGVSPGFATLSTAPLPGYTTGSAGLKVAPFYQSIAIPKNLTLATGESTRYPVTISAPASTPVTITFGANGTGHVSFSPTSVTIPVGAITPPVQPEISCTLQGTVFVTASAPNYGSDTETVNLSTTLSLSPGIVTVLTANTVHLALSSSTVAPRGGFRVDLSLSDATKASVPATVTIPAGQSSVNLTVTGLAAGSTTLEAGGAGFVAASAAILVATPGSFSMIGDSRAEFLSYIEGHLNYASGYQWFNAANALSGQNMLLIANYGISGDRSDQFLNANLAAALSDTAGVLIFNSGAANDIGQCTDSYINSNGVVVTCSNVSAVAAANIINAAQAALTAGKQVILVSETGNTAFTSSQVQAVFEYNQSLQSYAAQTPGVNYFDATPYYWSASTSPSAIFFQPGVSTDGLHPNTLGSFYIGQAFSGWIPSAMPRYKYVPPSNGKDTTNDYLANPLFENPTGGSTIGSVTGPIPASFTVKAGQGTTITSATVPDPNGFGNDLVLSITATTADLQTSVMVSPGTSSWNLGDTAYFSAAVNVAAGSSNFYCFLQPVITTSGGTIEAFDMVSNSMLGPGPSSAYSYLLQTQPLTIPSTGTKDSMVVTLNLNFSAAGSATVTISRFDAWK